MFPEPVGLRAVRALMPRQNPATRLQRYQIFIFVSTFFSYLSFHMTRRPIAVVKAVLNYNGSCYKADPLVNFTVTTENAHSWCDWEPFGSHPEYLAYLDTVYLCSYAVCMFASGFIAERMHLRYFLSLGMVLSGFTTFIFGMGHTFDIHSIWFYLAVQLVAGGVQSAGWPAVVTMMNAWFGKNKKGLIFGVWNAHTSVGNIVGALLAGIFVEMDWAFSFYVPGILCCAVGMFIFFFVPASPEDVGMASLLETQNGGTVGRSQSGRSEESLNTVPSNEVPANVSDDDNEHTNLINSCVSRTGSHKEAISFWRALLIPGEFIKDNVNPFRPFCVGLFL